MARGRHPGTPAEVLFVAGCEENQAKFHTQFDQIILLSAPVETVVERLATRINNSYGKAPEEFCRFLDDVDTCGDHSPLRHHGERRRSRTLLVAKAYKIRDRVEKPGNLNDKDAGDVVRLMMIDEGPLEVAKRFRKLLVDGRTSEVVKNGLGYLNDLLGARATVGTEMAVAALAGGLDERTIRALALGYVAALCGIVRRRGLTGRPRCRDIPCLRGSR